jgi:2-methylcitrate dehydratase PrpD
VSVPLATRLAEWLSALAWPQLPPRQQELSELRLLDSLGLILAGTTSEATSIARGYVAAHGGVGRSTAVATSAGTPAGWAALVNGIAAHCWDFDDTFSDSVVHPGSMVVPSALAVGEDLGASGAEILTAIAGGYEIAARLAGAGGRRFHARGFHASGIFAPVISAFVAARLMRLPAPAMASAVGLAASMSGGLLAFLADDGWSKWLHFGWGNFGGILAAGLAQDGFRGPAGALDGRFNLYDAFLGDTPDPAAIAAGLGARWCSEAALFKLYPCAHVIQPYIDLTLDMRSLSLAPQAVKKVICTVASWAVPIVCVPVAEKIRPQTTLQAIASLQFQVASALIDGHVGLDTIAADNLHRPEVQALASKVDYVVTDDHEGFAAEIALETVTGEIHRRAGRLVAVMPERLHEKFLDLAGPVLGRRQAENAIAAVQQLAAAPDARQIGRILRSATSAAAKR